MKRECTEYGLDKFKKEFPELSDSEVRVFYDTTDKQQCGKLVHEIIVPFNNKFKHILRLILKGEYQDNLYKIEDEDVTAIKFLGKATNNARIYCKEIYKNGKKVVMITPYYKKVQRNQNDSKIMQIIDNIKKYEYDI